jgi:hypothetical protein
MDCLPKRIPQEVQFSLNTAGGLLRREDECQEDGSAYGHNTEYAVKLDTCDEWTMAKEGEYAATFDLDAADVFNEASLINDVRFNGGKSLLLERDDNESFVELLVNGWPHVFIITTKAIKRGKEFLIDYGKEYWNKRAMALYNSGWIVKRPRLICWKQRIRDCGLPVDICIYAYLCCTSKGGIYASL